MNDIPAMATIHDRRDLMPPDPAAWQAGDILRTEQGADGSWSAVLTLGHCDYWVRGYRMDGGRVRFEFQARRCRKGEAAWLAYVDGLSRKVGA